ncbi:MAG: type II toxin-antitoxin system RatA family toxin [Burkholderiales bacterium]|nr:type II toxin-antitoxin system RatA family toxin [Burkholderiales bacterium]
MAVVHKSVFLGYSAQQMYALVGDIEAYPEFLPWCGGVTVERPQENQLVATLAIQYKGVQQSFTTQNINTPHSLMKMQLVDGPFKALNGTWAFKELRADACKVEFDLRYEFSSKLLEQVIGPVFGVIANSFVDSFCKRAEKVYG